MKTFLFDWKKWTLVILCALNIVIMIVYAALCKLLADRYLYDYETFEPYRTEDAKLYVIITLLVLSIFSIAFSILGMVGAIMESFTITSIFAILSLINFVMTLANSIKRPYYVPCAIWALLILAAAIQLTRDLQIINRRKKTHTNLFR